MMVLLQGTLQTFPAGKFVQLKVKSLDIPKSLG